MSMATFSIAPARAQEIAARVTMDVSPNDVLARVVTIDLRQATVEAAINALAASANVTIQYRSKDLEALPTSVSVHMTKMPLRSALEQVLRGTGLYAVPVTADVITLKYDNAQSVVQGIISGKVIDMRTKRSVYGAVVTLDGATKGVLTDQAGVFRFTNVTAGTHTVRVRLLGYMKASKTVAVVDAETSSLEVMLEPTVNALDQIVVTGTVIPTQLKAVSNAITIITAQDIERRGITHIDQLFHGDVPGLFAQSSGQIESAPGQVSIASRGSTYLSVNGIAATAQPIKTYVDGVELADASYLGLIDPKSIERIEILTGPQASTIYGSGAINGVMQIFTKRGTTVRPQLTVALQTGMIQNNFNSALAPQHDDMLQLSGVENHMSYNIGGSWNYVGRWAVASNSTLSGFGGVRLHVGSAMLDASVRQSQMVYHQSSNAPQGRLNQDGSGRLVLPSSNPYFPLGMEGTDQTVSLGATVTPVSWWSQTVTIGTDHLTSSNSLDAASNNWIGDTATVRWGVTSSQRLTLSTSGTLNVPLTDMARAVITVGGDATNFSSTGASYLNYAYSASKSSSHNRGGYLQSQLGVWDALFLTYGVRAEWSPLFGPNVSPNVVPKYGVSVVREMGLLTAKLRATYGHSTRPPDAGQAASITVLQISPNAARYWPGNAFYQFANPDLVPAEQRGGEGGIELYFGQHVSLTITRFNQTINNLIQRLVVDSVDMLPAVRALYGFAPWQRPLGLNQYLNVGSIRNQGWEGIGSVTLGSVTTRMTLSNTKSRIIGITPRWRRLVPDVVVGQAFTYVPEHLWALESVYSHGGTSLSFNLHGQGPLYVLGGGTLWNNIGLSRLDADRVRMDFPFAWDHISAYTLADLNLSQHVTANADGILQVQNLRNTYMNDSDLGYASMGRQTKFGLRIRM